jgi:hypothetical protein
MCFIVQIQTYLLTLIQINFSFQFPAVTVSIVFKKVLTGQLTGMAQHKPPPLPPLSTRHSTNELLLTDHLRYSLQLSIKSMICWDVT